VAAGARQSAEIYVVREIVMARNDRSLGSLAISRGLNKLYIGNEDSPFGLEETANDWAEPLRSEPRESWECSAAEQTPRG
jgi:hypothetical protein